MEEQELAKGFIGLPANLLEKDEHELPRIFSLLPGFNREERRRLATVIRPGHRSKNQRPRRSEVDPIIEGYRNPQFRRQWFWIEVGAEPPAAGEFRRSLYLAIDYWLLREIEPNLDQLIPVDDIVLRELCPRWHDLVDSMKKWSVRHKSKIDLRYFALWPRIIEALEKWDELAEEERVRIVNGAFALSSISGDPWFVVETERRCPAITPYLAGLTVAPDEDEELDEEDEEDEEEPGESTVVSGNADGGLPAGNCVSDGRSEWRSFAAQLREIADQLERELLDPSLGETLDRVWNQYEQLKQQCPLRVPAADRLRQQMTVLEAFLHEVSAEFATGILDPEALAGVVGTWQAIADSARSDDDCDRVRLDAERAVSAGRIAIGRLSQAHTARAGAEAEHGKLKEAEKSAVDWTERKAARRALGDLEATLARLRREEEENAEEELLAAVAPKTGVEPAVDPEPVAQIAPAGAGAVPDSTPAAASGSSAPVTPVTVPAGIVEPATPEVPVEPPPDCGEAISDAGAPGSPQGDAAAPVVAAEPAVSPVNVTDPTRGLDLRFNAQAGSICAPIWQALRTGNVALAHHAATAINAIDPDVTLPSPALLAAVALGRRLQSPGGPIAEALRQKFAEIDRNEFETGPELWQLANNLLLLAACLRPLILAPDTGASAIAQYVHLGAGLEPLFEVQRLLGEYGQRMKGNRLDAAALGAIRSRAAWDAEFGQLQRDIDDWLDRARRFTVKFRAALDVWRCWINQDGAIGRLTGFLQSSSASAMPEVLELCETLRGTAGFRALVDETDRRQLKRNRGEDIHAAAFEQLRQKAAEAVILGERWMSLMEAQPSQGDYLSRQLSELQGHLAKAGKEAMEVLKPSVDEDPWGQLTAARLTLKETLAGLLELFTGTRTPIAPEPKPEIVLGESLLRTGRVSLDAEWRPEGTPEIVLDAAKSFLAKPDTTREALDSYIVCGDLENARRLLDLMDGDAGNREELTRIFERETVRKQDEFRAESRKVEEELSLALAYSLIGEKDRVDLAGRVAGLEFGHAANLRFDLCRRVLADIQSQIAERRAERAAELTTRLEQLSARHPEQDYRLIVTAIEEGDFPVATEYLHRVEQDPAATLAPAAARDLFNDFFPERCRQLLQMVEKLDATSLRKVIQERLNAAGVSFGHLSPERATAAAATWTQWTKLKSTRAPGPELVRALLLSLGFRDAVVAASSRPAGRVREYSLVTPPLSERDICQSPHFGSRAEGRYRIACLWDPPGQEDFRQLAGDATTGPATIALYFGSLSEQKRRELSGVSRGERRQSFLLIDEPLLLFICGEEDSPLAALFQCGLPFTYSDPFVTTSSVVPPEMFFGRAEELASIKSMDGRCFVYGGRQLGKTALLRQAEREFHMPAEGRVAVWIDLKRVARPDEIWVPVWRELRKHGIVGDKVAEPRRTERTARKIDDFVHTLEQWMADHPKQRILLLLDEADRFLEFDARDGFLDTRRLKALMEVTERRFKVVFAGLHNVLRTTEQANHPLAHFGEAIEVGPLIRPDDLRAARELVLRPLMAAGFAFESERRADRILALTNYYPSLIQLYCSKLLHELLRNGGAGLDRRAGPRYAITARHLDSVYARQDLRDEIRSKFLLTLKLDPRYNLITYALAYEMQQGKIELESGAPVDTIRRIAESWWEEGFERTAEPAFRVLLQEMVGLGVLREVQPGRFTLRNPNVLLLLGSATEIGEELLRERELPSEYEPRYWRMALSADPTGPRRSPLTVSQVADVVALANGVVVVAGSEAAGIREVQEAVSAATETGFFRLMEPGGTGGPAAFQRTLDKLTDRKAGGTTVLFVGPDCPWSTAWVQHACARVERLKSEKNPVRVVFIADPTTLRVVLGEGLPDAVQMVALEPWSDAFLKEWLQETNHPSDSGLRRAILEQTGGWPEFVYEWQPAGGQTIDSDGEAHRRLGRLGLDDPHVLSAMDDKAVHELTAGAGSEATAHLIRWAALLGLLRIGGDAKVHIDPYVAELIMRV